MGGLVRWGSVVVVGLSFVGLGEGSGIYGSLKEDWGLCLGR